jgi:23S rRNA pseudouridine2605 synthase
MDDEGVSRPERVQKLLARAGLGSRRKCEDLVREGRVKIDGIVATLGDRADPETQQVLVDDVPLSVRPDLVYYVLNKPSGVVTTASDPQGRPTVIELVPGEPRVFPVGRLDADTEGLLVLTNDGDLAQLLAHPRHGVDKTYVAEVAGKPSDSALRELRTGVQLDDGPTAPAKVRIAARTNERSAIELTIHEGRKRQVRRMCAAIGYPVERLVRTKIGPLADARLAPGTWRALAPREVRALYEAAHISPGADTAPGSEEAQH